MAVVTHEDANPVLKRFKGIFIGNIISYIDGEGIFFFRDRFSF